MVLLGILIILFGSNVLTSEQAIDYIFRKPCTRYLDKTDTVCNGFIAISNGGLTGKGLGFNSSLCIFQRHMDLSFNYN